MFFTTDIIPQLYRKFIAKQKKLTAISGLVTEVN